MKDRNYVLGIPFIFGVSYYNATIKFCQYNSFFELSSFPFCVSTRSKLRLLRELNYLRPWKRFLFLHLAVNGHYQQCLGQSIWSERLSVISLICLGNCNWFIAARETKLLLLFTTCFVCFQSPSHLIFELKHMKYFPYSFFPIKDLVLYVHF